MDNKLDTKYWALDEASLFSVLNSSASGLSSSEAKDRLAKYGLNEIPVSKKPEALRLFVAQLKNPLVLILVIAAAVSFFLGEQIEALVIFGIILINSILGFYQEYKAEKILFDLRKMVIFNAKVLRDGKEVEIDSREIVPGDIVFLNIGDIVPADIRILHCEDLSANEANITGESIPVEKKPCVVKPEVSLPQGMANMVFEGTSITSGIGKGIVVATGMSTFFGKSASYLKEKQRSTYFQQNIENFGSMLLKLVLLMTFFIFVANFFLGKPLLDSFIFSVALAVGITPEVLPVIITISLSDGAMRMAKKNVIIKKLVSVEDFGNIDTLCCDKTGTLTEGSLKLFEYVNLDGKKDKKLLLHGMLCNSGKKVGKNKSFGNPVDKAIWDSNDSFGLMSDFEKFELLDEVEFDFERRRMSVLVNNSGKKTLIVKGSPFSVMSACDFALTKSRLTRLGKKQMQDFAAKVENYERNGFIVIAVAEKDASGYEKISAKDENKLVLLGFLVFHDPPKHSTRESLKTLQELGVNIKIITGDSPLVTGKICEEVGLSIYKNKIVTGDELASLDEKGLEDYAQSYNVFARITPEQKFKIVSALNKEGHVVGYLGDGVNDVPALKAADVSITVDTASGIAKDAADIIILNKNLKVVVDGLVEGRKTFGNITKYILNTISANFGNMFTVAFSSLFLKFIPLLPSQILLNNFISDVPLLTISKDNVDKEMLKKPKKWNLDLISKFMVYFGIISTLFDLLLIFALIFFFNVSQEVFRTAWFVESAISEIIITFSIRTKLPFYKSVPSKLLLATSTGAILLILWIVYSSLGGSLFEFVSLPIEIIWYILLVLVLYFATVEIVKKNFYSKYDL